MTNSKPPTLRERLEEIGVGVVVIFLATLAIAVVGLVVGLNISGGGSDSTTHETGSTRTRQSPTDGAGLNAPPPVQQAMDESVPDAKGPVRERVWAMEGARTFEDPRTLAGEGRRVPSDRWVLVACKIYRPELASVAHRGYWYLLLTPPWEGLYSPANSYWNAQKPGEPPSYPVDWRVRSCKTE